MRGYCTMPGILMRRYRRLYGDEDCLGQCVALSFTVAASRYSKQCCKVNVVELLTSVNSGVAAAIRGRLSFFDGRS